MPRVADCTTASTAVKRSRIAATYFSRHPLCAPTKRRNSREGFVKIVCRGEVENMSRDSVPGAWQEKPHTVSASEEGIFVHSPRAARLTHGWRKQLPEFDRPAAGRAPCGAPTGRSLSGDRRAGRGGFGGRRPAPTAVGRRAGPPGGLARRVAVPTPGRGRAERGPCIAVPNDPTRHAPSEAGSPRPALDAAR